MSEIYKNMSELLEERELNEWKLQKFEIKNDNIRAMFDGITPGKYIRLLHNGECVMSDTNMEKIIMAIQDKPEVNTITVIEKNQEVIDLVASQLNFNDKVNIVCADVFEWKPERGVKYDMAYMDIWNWINEDVYKNEMQPLKRKYARFLRSKNENPRRFNKCWAEYQAKTGRRLA